MVAPQVRLELTTLRLTAECSAIELLRIIRGPFAARLPAGGSLFCFQLALALSLGHRLSSHIAFSPLSLGHRLGFAARPASARCPVLPYVREREKLSFLPLPVDPGNFLLSQAVPSSVPSAFGGLTSVFGMGTGGALQLSSPETFPRGASPLPVRFASLFASASRYFRSVRSPLPAPSKLHRSEFDQQTPHSPSSSLDQALDRLVSASSTPHSASTADLSTSSSLRGLTCSRQWQSSSSGGLHA